MRRSWRSSQTSTFFGLAPNHKELVRKECFVVSVNSKGAVSYAEAKLLPTGERKWFINELTLYYEEQNKDAKSEQSPLPDDIRRKIAAQSELAKKAASVPKTQPKTNASPS